MSENKVFWLIMIPILFICSWITMSVVDGVFDNTPKKPSGAEIYRDACLKKGGIPNTNTTAQEWRCDDVATPK